MGFGVLLPVLAIVRNWSLDKQDFWAFFADVISGAFLLFAVWKVSQKERVGKRYLAAAWGLVCGLFYSSFAYQVVTINAGSKPETIVATRVIARVKNSTRPSMVKFHQ